MRCDKGLDGAEFSPYREAPWVRNGLRQNQVDPRQQTGATAIPITVRRVRRFQLNAIEVGGFKSAIEPVTVRFRPLTVLAGQNSAGKSTAIQPLLLLKQTMERPFDPGGLAIDGPLVQFTNADQFFSHSAAGRANEFYVKLSSEDFMLRCTLGKQVRGVLRLIGWSSQLREKNPNVGEKTID